MGFHVIFFTLFIHFYFFISSVSSLTSKELIVQSSKSSSSNEILVSDLGSPEGVAVDWIARNLYWTDSGYDKIQVSKLDGSHIKTLFSKNLTNPRSIVVDPIRGWSSCDSWILVSNIHFITSVNKCSLFVIYIINSYKMLFNLKCFWLIYNLFMVY